MITELRVRSDAQDPPQEYKVWLRFADGWNALQIFSVHDSKKEVAEKLRRLADQVGE